MPVLRPGDERLGANPDREFISPFPSSEANLSAIFGSLQDMVATLPGASPGGVMAAAQAKAWTSAQRRLMFDRVTSEQAGGIRMDWLPKVANIAKSGAVEGLFANAQFPPSTSENKLGKSLAKVGLDVGLSILTAVPVYGQILKAAVAVGAFIAGLFKKKEEEIILEVPWEQYCRNLDQDVVNRILPPVMGNVDWTFMYMPALDWAQGFDLERTKKGGETRAWGVFHQQSGDPLPGPGAGMMPGTERLTQTMQVAMTYRGPTSRMDAITDVGSFWPATSQFLTGTWSMADKLGNPDMYKVRASELRDAWRSYFETMFADAWARWGEYNDPDTIFLAKMLGSFLYSKDEGFPDDTAGRVNLASFGTAWMTPDLFQKDFNPGKVYKTVEQMFVRPALTRLMKRQKSALARSLVCALVRPNDVGELPRFAAFDDKGPALDSKFANFGAELRDEAKRMRQILLTHPDRYELARTKPGAMTLSGPLVTPDVRVADPKYANKLEATLGSGGFLKARTKLDPVLDKDVPEGPDAEPPGGGSPFPFPKRRTLRKYVYPIAASLGIAGGAVGAYLLGESSR